MMLDDYQGNLIVNNDILLNILEISRNTHLNMFTPNTYLKIQNNKKFQPQHATPQAGERTKIRRRAEDWPQSSYLKKNNCKQLILKPLKI